MKILLVTSKVHIFSTFPVSRPREGEISDYSSFIFPHGRLFYPKFVSIKLISKIYNAGRISHLFVNSIFETNEKIIMKTLFSEK